MGVTGEVKDKEMNNVRLNKKTVPVTTKLVGVYFFMIGLCF